jgi:outer membrane protein TolC
VSCLHRTFQAGGFLLAAVLAPGASGAGDASVGAVADAAAARSAVPRDLPAPEIRVGKITLKDAIRLTLENAPDVLQGRLDVVRRRGLLQESSGRFDSLIAATPSYERDVTFLTQSALTGEVSKRDFLRDSTTNLTQIATEINRSLADPNGKANVDCKGHQYFINGAPICSDVIKPTDFQTFQLLEAAQALPFDPNSPASQLSAALNKQVSSQLQNVVALVRRVFLPALDEQLVALGALPSGNENDTWDLDLRYELPMREGMVVSTVVFGKGVRSNFTNKADNPALGGQGSPTLYRVGAGLGVDLPLLKGAGATSVAAEERAARLNVGAAQHALAQTAAANVLNTVVRYWTLASAMEQLGLLQQSAANQGRIGELSEALVQGDELPRADLDRVRARAADVEASVVRARQNVETARVELARAMGLTVTDLDAAPVASDPLPAADELDRVAAVALQETMDGLAAARGDVKAARAQVAAADALLAGARVDLRPTLNLSLQAGFNAIWQDQEFRIAAAINPTGLSRAFGSAWFGPSVQVGLTFGIPVGNHAARGRVVQLEALRGQSLITERDTVRSARLGVLQSLESARAAAREVSFRAAASRYGVETMNGSAERYKAGDMSAIDAVETEQRVTQSLLDGLGARLALATLAAQTRFEAGILLPYSISGDEVSFAEATPLFSPGK